MDAIDPVLLTLLPQDIKNLFFPYASVQLWALLLNLLLGFLLASIIGLHFRHYSSAFCNRQDFSRLFPLLMLTVILIITVVKASLALALGLVGALSIVRFRTPIKEPEELIYLFLNIGIAVALGAGQTLAALLACAVTLVLVTWTKRRNMAVSQEQGLFLSINDHSEHEITVSVNELKNLLASHSERLELRRFDCDKHSFSATFFITATEVEQLDSCLALLKQRFPTIKISLLEQHNIAGV
ncbi:DUF4956 domain-containing protein [Photobacterium phosphoreum]|uniref:DUF4956 domain-containing protein n=1 Tax=Photobacterium phosphoreum TaxID=659 RepID=A0A2T3JVT8_PHOPO|nr:DUF4956 domain-containing protein [Photobacterium phosphoreum]MCD9469066.1 DUF4956 domain-containing protein [Photobacterium phosphoreum]PSU26886.1 DUF4956 domain-containing protein [Photobacterium phosphoreum]PSU44297.1 DUF4956 domain-containing protein [Photobacterium phosphoreum]PSU53455.1 DUF4956 domain-containing protein [Photobacterium phosphoreum]PSU63425.1 DUF4956 domain-containing protein [Photobacterium phosphoreum]